MLDFDNMALGVDNPNKNDIITPCSVDLVDFYDQPSILVDILSPFPWNFWRFYRKHRHKYQTYK